MYGVGLAVMVAVAISIGWAMDLMGVHRGPRRSTDPGPKYAAHREMTGKPKVLILDSGETFRL